MQKYDVYLSGTKQEMDISPEATLSELRTQLHHDEEHNFLYYNPFTEKKTVLEDRSLETVRKVKEIAIENIITMALVEGNKTDLMGMKADWLYDRHTGVKIILNKTDEQAKKQNEGKFQPIMITDIQPTNNQVSAFYDRGVICEKGSVINFKISSWGAAGFGYSVKSSKQTICNALYNSYGDNKDRKSNSELRRYQGSKNSIVIESTENLNIPSNEVIYYQKITVKTWRMTSYKKDGKTYTSNTQAPTINAPKTLRFSINAGFDPGPTEGDIFIPGEDVETASPSEGAPSNQSLYWDR